MGDTKPFPSLSFCGLFRVSELGLRIFAIGKIAQWQVVKISVANASGFMEDVAHEKTP